MGCKHQAPASPERTFQAIEQRFAAGDLAEAEAASARATNLTTAPLWSARLRVQHGRIALYRGRYQQAVALLRPALPAALADDSLAVQRGSFLAIALRRSGEKEHATQVLVETEKLCRNELSCAEIRLAQGLVEIEGANLNQATVLLERGLQSAHARGDRFVEMQFLLNLGVVRLRQEHYDEALQRFAAQSVLAEALGAKLALEKSTGNIGWTLYKLGDYRRALATSQRAGNQAAALGVPVDQVRWLNDAGLSQYRLGDYAGARSSYQHSLELARTIHNLEGMGDALLALGGLSLHQGDWEDAVRYSREARQTAEERGNMVDTLRPDLIEALVLEQQGSTSQAERDLLRLEKASSVRRSVQWEVENALARLAEKTGNDALADKWFSRAIATYRLQRMSVTDPTLRLPFIENGADLYVTYMQHLIREDRTEAALAVLDSGRAASLSDGLLPATHTPAKSLPVQLETKHPYLDPRRTARALSATILVYSLQPGTSYLWVVTARDVHFVRLPGKEMILPLIARLNRSLVQANDPLTQPGSPACTLFEMLVKPAQTSIASGGRVIVIADGGMNSLNFETLVVTTDRTHFWIEDVNITNARSLALLERATARRSPIKTSKRLLLIADPPYNHADYEALPHAHEEATNVAHYFTDRKVFTGAEATPAAYALADPGTYSHIHFVAHATANEESPLDSSIILAQNGGQPSKLYARDILEQKLDAELVTISSCYGSGVPVYSGEGLVGLAWAFLHAGAHNVIAALWQVDDGSTPRLISDLYEGVATGISASDALRQAKLKMIRSGTILHKPYYWASFQLYTGA